MKKINDSEIIESIKTRGNNIKIVASNLNLSYSATAYRIRQLIAKGRLDADGNIINQEKIVSSAINRSDAKSSEITDVVSTELNIDSFIPKVNPSYIDRQGIDDIISLNAKSKDIRNRNITLIGEAGSGKTELTMQYASKNRLPFLRVSLDDTSALKEFLGKREIKNGTTYFKLGILSEMVQKPSVILFDEFNSNASSKLFFLHELLDNRILFIKDADAGRIIKVHDECIIFLACNYNNAKYSGTNRTNSALADRVGVINVPPFNTVDMKSAFDTGNDALTLNLMRFYDEVNKMIKEQDLRLILSIRGIKRIVSCLKDGASLSQALNFGIFNHALLTASDTERDSIIQLSRVIFGADKINLD